MKGVFDKIPTLKLKMNGKLKDKHNGISSV